MAVTWGEVYFVGLLDFKSSYEHFWDALLISNIDNVINSIERASDSADKLSKRIFWLTWALVILGALALIVVGYGVFFK